MSRSIDAWLARLSDPAGLNGHWPAAPLPADDARAVDALLYEAVRHNVHLAVHSNLLRLLRDDPAALLAGAGREAAAGALSERVRAERSEIIAPTMQVAAVARAIRQDLAGFPAVIVKGIDFAENAYGGVHLRSFGDVDILVRAEAAEALGALLSRKGFVPHGHERHAADYAERQWINGAPGATGTVLVEVHTDLVHTPELRRRLSLTYDLHAGKDGQGVTPAARLVLAALHGATSHLFGRLQYVVDGLMVARSGVDPDELAERAQASGAALPVYTMLRLASELYGCTTSAALAGTMAPRGIARLERRLITSPMVLAAKSPNRWRLLAQRHVYRRLLQV
jgi:hypothetical protein